ncbi:MAG: tRNA (adenosine(37)-N6)-threonylcarbamoyltransferase complex ATPase subunit type 1 TsaE [Bacteroidetes bacterium GWF2_42_66]|nr:MAG: tRNA (adenosine(37)-N6)-threonylcarbamoyltransferase complex ATPase subunit type 1 TsaE [Bacteroidetes bacterium GWA2_42_15]OFX97358.1 MAG: tRNA (adenosine(37)-N6)-threonylcarbamoyltransferase complex ATPase subunit type 1 TsaE [Bacteroidetes bacterium GWE2_42_39]OFY39995.1 MAG: tRNA (adenosine(37)-N6)-threonylcarbamoyltransferase complex ATPase subunit type 1 TsaE [Bacteroidetes bacterium GWF2_42_66]HBL78191.1 tRNA (adenosine(37)-N6)-threonylcarbamoyltransferase complex ATPase subunit t
MKHIEIKSLNDIKAAAKQFLHEYNRHRIFAFYGKMGSGKTTFIKALCEEMGSHDNVTSPTFSIINEYTTSSEVMIYHFDFYRIKNLQEAFDLGYEDYFFSGNYCFIEWPERVEQLLPEEFVKVEISVEANETRLIEVSVV